MNVTYIPFHLLTYTDTYTHSHTLRLAFPPPLTLLFKPHTLSLSFIGPLEPREDPYYTWKDLSFGREPHAGWEPDGRVPGARDAPWFDGRKGSLGSGTLLPSTPEAGLPCWQLRGDLERALSLGTPLAPLLPRLWVRGPAGSHPVLASVCLPWAPGLASPSSATRGLCPIARRAGRSSRARGPEQAETRTVGWAQRLPSDTTGN